MGTENISALTIEAYLRGRDFLVVEVVVVGNLICKNLQ